MKNVIDAEKLFVNRKCPADSLAMHSQYGVVRVVAANGNERTVEADHYDVHGTLTVTVETVELSELLALDMQRDLQVLQPARILTL